MKAYIVETRPFRALRWIEEIETYVSTANIERATRFNTPAEARRAMLEYDAGLGLTDGGRILTVETGIRPEPKTFR